MLDSREMEMRYYLLAFPHSKVPIRCGDLRGADFLVDGFCPLAEFRPSFSHSSRIQEIPREVSEIRSLRYIPLLAHLPMHRFTSIPASNFLGPSKISALVLPGQNSYSHRLPPSLPLPVLRKKSITFLAAPLLPACPAPVAMLGCSYASANLRVFPIVGGPLGRVS